MAKNEFLPFGVNNGANVLSSDEWLALSARSSGFNTGVAKSKEINTALRQSSVITNAVAQFIADNSEQDVLDNGDAKTLQINLVNALTQFINKGYLPLTGGILTGGLEVKSNTTATKYTIKDANGKVQGTVSTPTDGYVRVTSNVTGKYFEIDRNGNLNTATGTEVLEQGQRVYSPNNPPDSRYISINGGRVLGSIDTSAGLYEQGQRVYSPNNPPDSRYLSIHGGRVLGNIDTGAGLYEQGQRVYSPNNPPTQRAVSGDAWWYKDLSSGMIFQGGFASGTNNSNGSTDWVGLHIAMPNRILSVSFTLRNFAQGYETTWNTQTSNLMASNTSFAWYHGAREREAYWMAVGY
ncbi:gp53-like domain-containing protein [Serratia oryzae]|uniref:Putative tail fiber protein gp53-like C-terminal domain-containing protein n=1 Tax=Serratia oryzae TaxID=2034155 RepID=A0A1S8CI39_9GAMM|nr:hypothetical protein [Serratia oryzae]OMQ22257.1 hypothetical protein BMI79_12135 [Serratia oryzae]